MRILCVDDDPLWLGLLKEMVREIAGNELKLAASLTGSQALRLCEKTPFDVALIDLSLCDMSGYELMQRIHVVWPQMRLIALTGWSQLSTVSEAKAKGASYCLFKPVSLSVLADTLAACGVESHLAVEQYQHPAVSAAQAM